jgi:hypothetical protein
VAAYIPDTQDTPAAPELPSKSPVCSFFPDGRFLTVINNDNYNSCDNNKLSHTNYNLFKIYFFLF